MLKAVSKLFRNTLFRLSLLGAVLFVVSLFISLGYVYYATISSELRRVDGVLSAEVNELQEIYSGYGENHLGGIDHVAREVMLRSSGSNDVMYHMSDDVVQVGNLGSRISDKKLADYEPIKGDPVKAFTKKDFVYTIRENEIDDLQDRRVKALSGFLVNSDGRPIARLTIGRDVEAISRTGDRVKNAMLTSSLIALFLGLLSSLFVSRRFTKRIDAFNRLATDVRAGQLDRRAPRNYSEDELDLLAEHLNAMLDHIDRLMKAMRYAGDSIAHDLRSPLTRLRTRLESTAGNLKHAEASDALFSAAEDADELLSTFDKVLRIARLEAGEQREMLQELDPKTVLDDMAEFYEPACEDAGLLFSSEIESGQLILADRGLLSQAVSNLVENAIKYTPKGGAVKIELYRNKSKNVVIVVTDNGPGIPAEERERVKERFVRLDKSRTAPGSGLGLAMVDAIATLHEAEFVLADGMKSELGPGLSVQMIFPRRRHLRPVKVNDA